MHRVRAYTFDFCSFLSVAYTTLNKLFAVFLIYYLVVHDFLSVLWYDRSSFANVFSAEHNNMLCEFVLL